MSRTKVFSLEVLTWLSKALLPLTDYWRFIKLQHIPNAQDHIHYCEKCEYWYLCKQSESCCKSESGSVTSHRQHIDSMPIDSILDSGD